jgi:hypothetical protein
MKHIRWNALVELVCLESKDQSKIVILPLQGAVELLRCPEACSSFFLTRCFVSTSNSEICWKLG